jgi:N-acetylglucosamine kinase
MLYGFDIGGTKIAFGAFDGTLSRVRQHRFATPKDYATLLDELCHTVRLADSELGCQGSVGLGIPGIIDSISGSLLTANVPAANGRRLQEDLQERLGRPVYIDNDANCFALSEAMDAANQHLASVLGVILGTGVGAGMIFRGQIHNGLNHVAGELGHMRLPIDALQAFGGDLPVFSCGCGQRGCIDNYLSGRGFEQLFFHRFSERLAAQDIIQRYREGHPATVVFVEQFFELTACCFAGYLAMLDPELIVLGGGLSNFDELYRELPKRLPRYMLKFARVPRIEKARHGDDGGVRGAAFLPLGMQAATNAA